MATSVNSLGSVTSDQFLTLLVTQLQNQDPLDPINSTDFINQLSTLNTVQGIATLNASFSEMLKLQQLTQGVDLIGKSIEYVPAGGGALISGTVAGVTLQNGSFVLQVGNSQVGLDQVSSIQ